ncbi:2,5-dichloro-2,5-cyclohexadiene-1,4-diol dehydrogenase [Sistotremastrum suecicum HHB10207 ss-3]|uniref:2,5-dichloro-2,5-cyclohexadiene-1,4-diol dehydrogenase n=1 Tax=Sistotremastrum suecicum HHB10207 ss-3 TaxID=1314776 RepID=A0A165XTB4_9AGAM|nr:2,5-dichloro-2,5-cyclohexadiene-1,4-diol dehydrogenase [Sistotremastrum suecicum HHB10207 ss-3]
MALQAFRKIGGVALVTGAASGMGRATAQTLARAGCHLVLTDRNEAGLETTIKEGGIDRGKCLTSVLDVRDDGAAEELVGSIPKKLGRLDFAVNCAGILGPDRTFVEEPLEYIDQVLSINLRAQLVFNRAQVQAMLLPKDPLPSFLAEDPQLSKEAREQRQAHAQRSKGAIVNFASVSSYRSFPGAHGSYTISKHGITGLTRVMATMYGPQGIRTNAVAPGPILTPLTNAWPGFEEAGGYLPLRRVGQPQDVADLVAFLCSEESSFINGEIVAIDGGMLA